MAFKVEAILDQNTIRVSPRWSWKGNVGNSVKIKGFGELNFETGNFITSKLTKLLLNKDVDLRNPSDSFNSGPNSSDIFITVSVYLNGVNISVYFPELKVYA